MTKWVYTFGDGKAEGTASMRNLLGGKGANLAEMSNLGIPVPPGFSITTEVCTHFYDNGRSYPADLRDQVKAALDHIGALAGRGFGDPERPLLVSVRSGARASMPGMMDTVLNLGLNDETRCSRFPRKPSDLRFALDCYRRFIHHVLRMWFSDLDQRKNSRRSSMASRKPTSSGTSSSTRNCPLPTIEIDVIEAIQDPGR